MHASLHASSGPMGPWVHGLACASLTSSDARSLASLAAVCLMRTDVCFMSSDTCMRTSQQGASIWSTTHCGRRLVCAEASMQHG